SALTWAHRRPPSCSGRGGIANAPPWGGSDHSASIPYHRHWARRDLLVQDPLEHDLVDLTQRRRGAQGQQQMHLALVVQRHLRVLNEGLLQLSPRESVRAWKLVLRQAHALLPLQAIEV